MKKFVPLLALFFAIKAESQNKMGYTWIVGNNASFGRFDGTPNPPQVGSIYTMASPNFPYIFSAGHSNICDSSTGKLIFLSNGMQIFDTTGNIIENGDSLVPNKIYSLNAYPNATTTQGSLILPKGNNGEYYVFTPTVSDTTCDKWFLPNATITPYDMLLFHVVDMNANGGQGKVIKKAIPLLINSEMSRTAMQACRHSNGSDWWLLKKLTIDSNIIVRFLVTKDSIYGPYFQTFATPKFSIYEASGQCTFNPDGTKFAIVQGKTHELFLADFDRCTGELNNPILFNIPIDSTGNPPVDNAGARDTISTGVSFSKNGQFLYISKSTNIYQFEYNQPDSALAWYNVRRGADTTWASFEYYSHLYRAPDDKIYIGKIGGSHKQFSVINSPNNKGVACDFCRKCFRVDSAIGGLTNPPNMPDYELGPSGVLCWPLESEALIVKSEKLEVWPNPAGTSVFIKTESVSPRELYNSLGQLVFSTKENEIDVRRYSKGVYYLKAGNQVKKLLIE